MAVINSHFSSPRRHEATELSIRWCRDDISKPIAWSSTRPCDQIIVHLGGQMNHLETELEGHSGSVGGALPGELWTIPAGRHYSSSIQGVGAIHYALLEVSSLSHSGSQHTEMTALAGVADPRLHADLVHLASLVRESHDISSMQGEALHQSILSYIIQRYSLPTTSQKRPVLKAPFFNDRQVKLMREYIHSHLSMSLSLEHLASLMNMTVHHLLIAFRKAFGSTPWQYILTQRFREARRLLLNTRQDITTIAMNCGFSSHSHLTTSFHKSFGQTPLVYRQNKGC